jgi:DNA relaxase NicK
MRWSGPRERLDDVIEMMRERFGQEREGKAGFFLAMSRRWAAGAGVYYDPAGNLMRKHIVFELPGSFMAPVPGAERVELMRKLRAMGFKPTRLDLAIDWRGVGIQLIEGMRGACESGELCGARRWKPHREFSGRRVVGDGLSIGVRGGDGSGRYVRAYDKGLETGTEREGGWVRLELELADDCACQAAEVVCEAGQWEAAAVELVLGAVDFREVTGDKHLAKRPRAAWWAAVLDGVEGVRVVASRSASKLQTWAAWMKRAVARPLQTYADEFGMSLAEVLSFVVGERVDPSRAAGMTAVGHQLRELIRECRGGGGVLPARLDDLLPATAG